MYRVGIGHKVKNVKDGNRIRHYQAGENLPKDYEPPKSYIDQKIVIKVVTKNLRGAK